MSGVPLRARKASEHVKREEGGVKLHQDGGTDGQREHTRSAPVGRALHPFIPVQPGCTNRTDLHPRGWQPPAFVSPSSSSCAVQHEPSGGTSSASVRQQALRLPPPPLHRLPRKRQSGFQRGIRLRRAVCAALEAPGACTLEQQLQSRLQQAGPSTNH